MFRRLRAFALARVPGSEREALAMAKEVRAEKGRDTPTMLGLLYTLGYHEDPSQSVDKLIDSVFPSREVAYEVLGGLWMRTRDRYPVYGVARGIALLEAELKVPAERSVLKQELPRPMIPEDYFAPKK